MKTGTDSKCLILEISVILWTGINTRKNQESGKTAPAEIAMIKEISTEDDNKINHGIFHVTSKKQIVFT